MRGKRFLLMLALLVTVIYGAWGAEAQDGDFAWWSGAEANWSSKDNWKYKSGSSWLSIGISDYPGTTAHSTTDRSVFLNTAKTTSDIIINLTENITIKDLNIEPSAASTNIIINLNGFNLTMTGDLYIGNWDGTTSNVNFTVNGGGTETTAGGKLTASNLYLKSSGDASSITLNTGTVIEITSTVANNTVGQSGVLEFSGDKTGQFIYTGTLPNNISSDSTKVKNSSGELLVLTQTFKWIGADNASWTEKTNWQQLGNDGTYYSASRYPGSEDGDTADFTSISASVSVKEFSVKEGSGNTVTIKTDPTKTNRLYLYSDNTNAAKIITVGPIVSYCKKFAEVNVFSGSFQNNLTQEISGKLTISENADFWNLSNITVLGETKNDGIFNADEKFASFNGGYSGTGTTAVSTGTITFGENTTNTVQKLTVGGAGFITNRSGTPVTVVNATLPIGDSENVRFTGDFKFTNEFTAAADRTFFLDGNVDFSGCNTFSASSEGTILFYNLDGNSSAKKFTTKSGMAFRNFYFGGNVDVVLNGDVSVSAKCEMSELEETLPSDFTATLTTGNSTSGKLSANANTPDDAASIQLASTGKLIIDADVECAVNLVHKPGISVTVNAGKTLAITKDYWGYGGTDDPDNEIIIKGKISTGGSFGAGAAPTDTGKNTAEVTVESGGELAVGDSIGYASKFTNKGTVSVTNSISGVTELVNEAGTITVNDSISGVASLQNYEGAELTAKSVSGQDFFNGGTIKTGSLNVVGSIDSCASNSTSLIEFTESTGTFSVSPVYASSSTVTNIKIDSGVTLTLGSPVVITGNVENNGTLNAASYGLTLKGTESRPSSITGTGQFVVSASDFSGENLSIGKSVTIAESTGLVAGKFDLIGKNCVPAPEPGAAGISETDYAIVYQNGWKLKKITFVWTGGNYNSSWFDPYNWSPEVTPGVVDETEADVLIPDSLQENTRFWPVIKQSELDSLASTLAGVVEVTEISLSSLKIGENTASNYADSPRLTIEDSLSDGSHLLNIVDTANTTAELINYGVIEYKGNSRICKNGSPANDTANGGWVEYSGTSDQTVTKFASGTDADYANLLITGNNSTVTFADSISCSALKIEGAGITAKFPAQKTLTVSNSFASKGTAESEILLTTDSASADPDDTATWWKIDVPASAISDSKFTNTKISYSESVKPIAHAWNDSVIEEVADSTINWFVSEYYWNGTRDDSWGTVDNWSFKKNDGNYIPAGKLPSYLNGRNSIFVGTNVVPANNLVLEDDITVKSLTVNSTGTIDLQGFNITADDSDTETKDFVNNGIVRLFGTTGQIASSVENGTGSTVEYYADALGTALELVWGNDYENLIFGAGANGTFSSAITVSGEMKILNGTGNSLALTGANVFANPVTIGDSSGSLAVSGGNIILSSDGNLQLASVKCDSLELQSSASILGSNVFDELICKTSGAEITFAAGETQTVTKLTIAGAAGNEVKLSGTGEWNITPTDLSQISVAHAVITNSKNTESSPIVVYAKDGYDGYYNIDGAGNTNWIFAGQEYVWQGGTTDWGEKSNWLPQVVPGKYSSISIPDGKANYPVLESEINLAKDEINFVLDSDGILVPGGTTGTAAETVASSVAIESGAVFDFNGFTLTANKLSNAGRIRLKGSEIIYSAGTDGIENLPLNTDSYLTGIIEYYGDFGSALNWGANKKFNQLEFTSGAKGSESAAISVKEEVLISNGTSNDLSFTGANIFEKGVKIIDAGGISLSGSADAAGAPVVISGDDSNTIKCDSLEVASKVKFTSDIMLDSPSVSFGSDVTGKIIEFNGSLASSGIVNVTADYVLASGSSSRTVSASAGSSLTFACDLFVDVDPSAEVTLSSDLSWTKTFCLYSGKVSAGAVNLSGKDFVVFGSSYSADDPRYSGADTRFAFYDYDSLPYRKALSDVCAEFVTSATNVVLDGNLYINGTPLSGCSFKLPDQSSSHPVFNSTSSVTSDQWGSPYAVAFNSTVSACSASASSGSAFVSAAKNQNVTDGSGNIGFQFAVPQIKEAYSVSDSVLCVKFDMALENSHGEVSDSAALVAALGSGGIFYNGKTLHFDGKFYTETDGTGCSVPLSESAMALADIPAETPLYLKVSSSENKWNTDATGLSSGANDSTDRSGTHRDVTTDLSLFEGLFYAADGKTMCRNYGIGLLLDESSGEYKEPESFATLDKARPVLIDVFAGQEVHVTNTGSAESQNFYDSHNFIELCYSEPVNIGNLTAGDDSLSQNQQAESEFASASAHGGAIINNASETGGLTVAGFVSIEKGELTAGIKSGSARNYTGAIDTARPHSLYRKFSRKAGTEEENFAARVRISVAGYVDEANPVTAGESTFHNWLGYIESSSTPSGAVIPLANEFITDLALDADGNRLNNKFDENNSSRTLSVNERAVAASDSLYGEWDCQHPVFAPYITNFDDSEPLTSWNAGDGSSRQYEMLGTVDSNTNAYIDKIEMHLFDNKPSYSPEEPYKWVSGKGWFDSTTGEVVPGFSAPESSGGSRAIPSSGAMTLGGIRRSSLEGADSAFSYKYSLDTYESETRSFAEAEISQHVKSSMFRIEEISETFTEDDGPYLGISINPEDSKLPIRTAFTVTYNPAASFITDLAGNRLLHKDEGSDVKILHTIDIAPPSFTMTLSPVGENKIYAVFTKALAYKGTYLHELGGELDSVLSKIVSNLEFVYSLEDNVDTRSVPEGDSSISVVSADLVSNTNEFTALLFTLNRKISLDDIEKIWIRVNDAGEETESLFGNITASFIQDKFGNPVPTHTCHALSDFAVNAVNVLYACSDSYDDDNWSEDEIYGEGLAPEAGDHAVHEFTEEGANYNILRAGRDIVFQLEFINSEDGGIMSGAANGEGLALVYDEKSNIRPEWKSNKYNLFTGSEWRLWLDNHLDALATNFNATPLSASLPALSPSFENVEDSEILKNMRWQNEAFNLAAGKEYQFFFKILDSSGNIIKINHDGDKTTQRIPLYAFRMPKERIAAGDFSFIDLWSFRTKDLTKQRGGVTILNNVINASTGEKTAVEVNMKSAGNLNVFVMTLDGNIVKRLSKGSVKAGTHYFYWDGKNNAGKPVARGLYFVRVSGKDIDETRKVMVIK